MQINRNNNKQQNPSFSMIRLPLSKDGKIVRHAKSFVYEKKIMELQEQGLVKWGRDKDFNPIKYITTNFNSQNEKQVLESLQTDSLVKIEAVDSKTANIDIERQNAYLDLYDGAKTKREDVQSKLAELFPSVFSK